MNPKNKIAEITTNEFIIHLQQAIFDIDGTAALHAYGAWQRSL